MPWQRDTHTYTMRRTTWSSFEAAESLENSLLHDEENARKYGLSHEQYMEYLATAEELGMTLEEYLTCLACEEQLSTTSVGRMKSPGTRPGLERKQPPQPPNA